MAIEFSCPSCGGTLRVEDDAVGQVVRCGGCMEMLRVPSAPPPPAFPDAPTNSFPGAEPFPPPVPPAVPRSRQERVPANDRVEETPPPPRRRRVRREPPPPMGRSPLFWVTITLGILGFGSCIFCCGLAYFIPQENWQTHKSDHGGFQVEMPSPPRKSISVPFLKQDPNLKIEGTRVLSTQEEYLVLYKDIEPTEKRETTDNELLGHIVQEFKDTPGIRKVEVKTGLEMCGFPAREITFRIDDKTYVVRAVVADSRLYFLVAGGQTMQLDEDNIQRFFNSFAITDEHLIAVAEARVERGRKKLQRREDLKQVEELGVALAESLFQTVAAEHEQAIAAKLKRQPVAELGKALGDTQFKILIGEQKLAAAERNRIQRIGLAVGKAITSAIENELAKIEDR